MNLFTNFPEQKKLICYFTNFPGNVDSVVRKSRHPKTKDVIIFIDKLNWEIFSKDLRKTRTARKIATKQA